MTDKITEKSEKELAVTKAQQDLDAVEYIPPSLLPTKETEIAAKQSEIKQKQEDHANGLSYIKTRTQYISIVQPLKNELYALYAENQTIISENRTRTETAQSNYQAARAPYEITLTEKQVELNTFIENTTLPLTILENATYAIVEDFNASAEKPLKVKRTLAGTDYQIWCYVSESVKNDYIAGTLQIGDVVIVIFVDKDITKPLAQQKVYKSW